MTVIRPNSISGITSITGNGGDISIFRADGTAADLIVNNVTTGVVTATTFSGNITGNLSGGTINATSGTVTGNLGVGGVLTYEDVTNIDSVGVITARSGINITSGRLLVGTTTAGESGADELTIENTSSDMGITLRTATNRQGTIMFSDATSGVGQYAGAIQYAHGAHAGADSMKFYTNSTTRMTIQNDGGIDINSTKAFKLHAGSTSDRPSSPVNGMIRYNTDTNALEGYIDSAWTIIKGTGLAAIGSYANNTQAVADDLYAYWSCDSTSTTRDGGDSGTATLYGLGSSGGKINNSWDRGTAAANGMNLGSMPTGNNWTLMFWAYLSDNTIHSSSDGAGILWLDSTQAGSVILGYDGSGSNNLRFGGNGWVADGEVVYSSFGTTGVWRHMVITNNSNSWKFYLNGSLITTRSETLNNNGSWWLANYSRHGGNSNNHYFRGRLDEIAIWHRTLTAAEITKVYDTQVEGTQLVP